MNKIKSIKENIAKVMVGQERVVDLLLTCLISEGHALMEDVPGMGKTVLARSLAKSVGAEFNRIQFTPDLLPSDVVGLNYFNQKLGDFIFKEGPAFCNILLADEINRATPRTQSSLLECMGEGQITVDGVTRELKKPFIVIATQNPIETLGTYPLPEAQLDRFLMRITMDELTPQEELKILERFLKAEPLKELAPVCSAQDILELTEKAKEVFVHPLLMKYIVDIAQASRKLSGLDMGVSPRGSLALLRACRSFALIKGRDYVVPEDIKAVAEPVLAHRIKVGGAMGNVKEQKRLVNQLLNSVALPTEDWNKK